MIKCFTAVCVSTVPPRYSVAISSGTYFSDSGITIRFVMYLNLPVMGFAASRVARLLDSSGIHLISNYTINIPNYVEFALHNYFLLSLSFIIIELEKFNYLLN